MKALTVHQPFASLIIAGAKPFEFRNRPVPASLIGKRVVIHASARLIRQPMAADMFVSVRDKELFSIVTVTLDAKTALPILSRAWHPGDEPLPLSAGLGTVIIGEPRPAIEIADAPGYPVGKHEQELWGWPMLEVKRWPLPVAASGAQGFWNWHGEVPE